MRFISFILAIFLALALTVSAEEKICDPNKLNDCFGEASGQFCVSIPMDSSVLKNETYRCRPCNPTGNQAWCTCPLTEYCYNYHNETKADKYATCQVFWGSTGARCDAQLTTSASSTDIKWGINEKMFCGQLEWTLDDESKRIEGENPRHILWRGACDLGICRICDGVGGNNDYDQQNCPDQRGCFKFEPHWALSGAQSWSHYADNAVLFITFWYAIITGPIIVVVFVCLLLQGRLKMKRREVDNNDLKQPLV